MGNADQDSVKVAAIGRYNESVRLEIELGQSLGNLPKVAEKVEQKIEGGINDRVVIIDNSKPENNRVSASS
jgi:hypothetical protein